MVLIIHTDGGSRGNPGPAAIGIVVSRENQPIIRLGKLLGKKTNNEAEYMAVVEALTIISQHPSVLNQVEEIHFLLDSLLVVQQLNGTYKVKQPHIQVLYHKVLMKMNQLNKPIRYSYVPREKNAEADRLVNITLDTGKNTLKTLQYIYRKQKTEDGKRK